MVGQFENDGVDLLNIFRQFTPAPLERPRNRWVVLPPPRGSKVGKWALLLNTMDGGLNKVWGDAQTDSNKMATGTLESSYPGYLTIPYKMTKDAVFQQASQPTPYCSCNIFGTMVVGSSNTANHSLLKHASTSSPTLIEVTFTPSGTITSTSPIVIGGATRPLNLAIGSSGFATQVLSDVVTGGPTVYGTMHANTVSTWAIITSPLNASAPGTTTLLIYAQGAGGLQSIATLSSGAAVGTAPTDVLTGVPRGGYAVGVISLGSATTIYRNPPRAFWVWPVQDTGSAQMFATSPMTPGKIVHTNLEGTDPQELKTSLNYVWWAIRHRDSIVYTDGSRICQYDLGETDLGYNTEHPALGQGGTQNALFYAFDGTSTFTGRKFCVGLASINQDLYCLSQTSSISASVETCQLEKYDALTKTWHPASAMFNTNTGADHWTSTGLPWAGDCGVALPMGGLPVSTSNGTIHVMPNATSSFKGSYWKYANQNGHSPFWNQSNIPSAPGGAQIVPTFEDSGVAYTPALYPTGLWGEPLVVEGCQYVRDLVQPNAVASYVKVEFASVSQTGGLTFANARAVTFNQRDPMTAMYQDFPDNKDFSPRLAMRITVNGGTTSPPLHTPTGLPIVVLGLYFTDGNVKSPSQCKAEEIWGRTR